MIENGSCGVRKSENKTKKRERERKRKRKWWKLFLPRCLHLMKSKSVLLKKSSRARGWQYDPSEQGDWIQSNNPALVRADWYDFESQSFHFFCLFVCFLCRFYRWKRKSNQLFPIRVWEISLQFNRPWVKDGDVTTQKKSQQEAKKNGGEYNRFQLKIQPSRTCFGYLNRCLHHLIDLILNWSLE